MKLTKIEALPPRYDKGEVNLKANYEGREAAETRGT